ncbi:AAA family ATPase [Saliterribacillus persicus]|uniref:Putative ATP-dependent endonuclease of OLD family n=1 Tax=Saliterribacillus persicus TaxID=930114 RepID=A0A368X4E8_9BACI|nr:ATP-binding protein [Saliterribacillus persicus]RCW62870.1 putative ATP-dependent endonuclease of OLD family [Saliterribacillus persicus]
MKIKKIDLENNNILRNITFDFTNEVGEVVDTIILAGENGTGKTTLLNLIFEFTTANSHHNRLPLSSESRIFTVIFNEEEIELLKQEFAHELSAHDYIKQEAKVIFDFTSHHNHSLSFMNEEGDSIRIQDHFLNRPQYRKIVKSLYSTTEINFNPNNIQSITAKIIDEEVNQSIKSNSQLANDITQLFIDINSQDNDELRKWVDENPGQAPPVTVKGIRLNRFIRAFETMFPNKKISEVRAENGSLKVYFKEFEREMSIENLSSGEKQIVFRGGFLLKDRQSTNGALILIDEPEISLHPDWQKKVLNFFQQLFTNPNDEQGSQIFISTHSPFIIHNENRINDKVIILKKDRDGKVFIPSSGEFYNWTDEKIVNEAFKINVFKDKIDANDKHLVITEGKTDWKHLKRALSKFRENGEFLQENFVFLEFEDEEMGSSNLVSLCSSLSKLNNTSKIIAVFDRDEPKIVNKVSLESGDKIKEWGNNVYSFTLPIPPHRQDASLISIEHYYTDEEIKTIDQDSRRLFLGNEFNQLFGIDKENKLICRNRNKCGENSIQIIDTEVFEISDQQSNKALSKSQFAQNILINEEPFNNIGFETFRQVFELIHQILYE